MTGINDIPSEADFTPDQAAEAARMARGGGVMRRRRSVVSDVMTIRTYDAQTYRIWVCRCPRRFWAERPAHLACADCGRLICEIEVAQVGARP